MTISGRPAPGSVYDTSDFAAITSTTVTGIVWGNDGQLEVTFASNLTAAEQAAVKKRIARVLTARQSSNASPSGTANVTCPGLSVSIPVTSAAEVWLVTIDADVQVVTTGAVNIIELLVDGALPTTITGLADQDQTLITSGPAGLRVAGTKTWELTGLSVGDHALTARTRNVAASTTVQVNGVHTRMRAVKAS